MIKKMITKIFRILAFILFYIKEVIIANVRIAYDILSPRYKIKPGVLAIPLDVETDFEILSINNLLTMTPGTLSLDISTDRRVIYVHAMYVDDPEQLRKEIKAGLEKKLMEVTR